MAVLALLHVGGAVTNGTEWALGSPPSALGTVASSLLVIAWPVAAWLMGRAGSRRFRRAAVVVWTVLLAVLGLGLWAIAASQETGMLIGDLLTLGLLFLVGSPFHGLAGLVPLAPPLRYVVVPLATAAVTALAHLAASFAAVSPDPGTP